MKAQLASEMLKLRTTRTTVGLMAGMLALIVIAVALHGYGLPAKDLATRSDQLGFLVGWGEVLGAPFAGLLGAMAFTGEIRHGTIRPTLLVMPRRRRVMAAKCLAAGLTGLGFGVVATSAAALTGRIALAVRGIDVALGGGDFVAFVARSAVAAGLWAIIGLGIGAIIRSQVPTMVGLLAWVLFVEQILVANAPSLGRLAPGALGQAVGGLHPDTLLASAPAAVALALYALAAMAVGTLATTRRDFV
ncbi:MAG: ABC transporter permease subunit [Acidimicrobiales bacterium]